MLATEVVTAESSVTSESSSIVVTADSSVTAESSDTVLALMSPIVDW